VITVSAVATTLFLGGWQPPPIPFFSHFDTGWFPVIWFVLKLLLFVFYFVWLRGTLPRLRYDQFMSFGWKILIPAGLVWVLAIAGLRTYHDHVTNRTPWIIGAAVIVGILLLVAVAAPGDAKYREEQEEAERRRTAAAPSLDRIPWPPPGGRAGPAVSAGAPAGTSAPASRNGAPSVVSAGHRPRQES
jgi:NADH-quinone oxidoreductase subunit H